MRAFKLLVPLHDKSGIGQSSAHSELRKAMRLIVSSFYILEPILLQGDTIERVAVYQVFCEAPEFQAVLDAGTIIFGPGTITAIDMGDAWVA